ncbi:major facilitator superfamily domain-containing protein [Cercophora scortea]|uniref:Major facilitator superfamily domain-containing protein n=1 Tax=Cercophora scortea TaxID=314031 RepID=A0AAE0J628_9PEZI|nr:major facilitator superfamily domain-containing protein [Cercophora scortea]
MARRFPSLYQTFGSGSTTPSHRADVQLTGADARLEEWKDGDDDLKSEYGSDISKEDADVTTYLIGTDNGLGEPEVRRRENLHRFDPKARWTWREERALVRKIDFKIMLWTCLMFCALEMDRANIRQAVTDNLLPELGLDNNDYNLGNSLFSLSFLLAEVPSQLVSKRLGPDRWIPIQMVLWSAVASSQFTLTGRAGFLVSRVLLGVLQGGFIPTVVLYLSYFYKSHELSIRLGFFWTAMVFADIFAALSAFALLHLRGFMGYSGWRWLFGVEVKQTDTAQGLITLGFGLLAFGLMPAGPTQTASWFRGEKGWFTPRRSVKGGMHNREPLTLRLLWKSLCDFDLWPLYLLGVMSNIPFSTPNIYLTLSLKDLGFTTFQTNLLVIPSQLLHVLNMIILTYLSEAISQLSLVAVIPQIWSIPFLLWLRFADTSEVSKWTTWLVMSIFLGNPYAHPIQVGWVSRNANTVRSRSVGSAMYNMCVQGGGIIAANIYRQDDAPAYHRGNSVLLTVVGLNITVYLSTKVYYTMRNRQRDRIWDRMSESERFEYLATTHDSGNKRLDFRFAS